MGRETLAVTGAAVVVRGALTDPQLLHLVLGRVAPGTAATVTGQRLVLADMSDDDRARLAFYAGEPRQETVEGADGPMTALVFGDDLGPKSPRDRAETLAAAGDIMALYGVKTAADVRARASAMAVRGAARVRAAMVGPTAVRFAAGAGDVQVSARREPYARFFAVEEYDLTHRRFDGGQSAEITRAAFISGDAVTVLPYDPVRDRVLLIEQFRAGPFARGDARAWQLEAIAGRIDPSETPEDAARREAVEEAGLTLGELLKVAQYYPSPGICAEYLYSYVAITDLPDGAAGVFGLDGEAEDIRGHLMPFEGLMALVASGEVANAPLILTAYWLAARRDKLVGGLLPRQNSSKEF